MKIIIPPTQRRRQPPSLGGRLDQIVCARHVEDPGRPVAGGVNLWGESLLCVNPVNVVRHGHKH
jgi:hypothetical protein